MVGCFSLYANEFCDEHAIYLISLESRSLNFRVFIHMYSLLPQKYFWLSLTRVLSQFRNK